MPKDQLRNVMRVKRQKKIYRPVGVRTADREEQWNLRRHGHVRFGENFGKDPAETADDYHS